MDPGVARMRNQPLSLRIKITHGKLYAFQLAQV